MKVKFYKLVYLYFNQKSKLGMEDYRDRLTRTLAIVVVSFLWADQCDIVELGQNVFDSSKELHIYGLFHGDVINRQNNR